MITIIILLILAGITIATLTNSGLFGKSQEAKEKWNNAQRDEEAKISELANEIDKNIDATRDNKTWTEIYRGTITDCANIDFTQFSEIRICFTIAEFSNKQYSSWNYFTVKELFEEFNLYVFAHTNIYVRICLKRDNNNKYNYSAQDTITGSSTWTVNTFGHLIEGI